MRADACSASSSADSDAGNFHWLPPDVDAALPTGLDEKPCPLLAVLQGVEQRMKQLVGSLQKFRATEYIEHFKVDGAGNAVHGRRARSTTSFRFRSAERRLRAGRIPQR